MQRCKTVRAEHSLLYALRVRRFANLDPILHLVAEIFLGFAFRTEDLNTILLFSSLNHTTRSLMLQTIQSWKRHSELGESAPSLFKTPRDKMCWQFSRCHCCGGRCEVNWPEISLLEDNTNLRIKHCFVCDMPLRYQRKSEVFQLTSGALFVYSTWLHWKPKLDFKKASFNFNHVVAKISPISMQKWKMPPSRKRRGRGPPAVVKLVRIFELSILLRWPGGEQTDHRICVKPAIYSRLKRATTSQEKLKIALVHALDQKSRQALLADLFEGPEMHEVETVCRKDRKRKLVPWRMHSRSCKHCFDAKGVGTLVFCSKGCPEKKERQQRKEQSRKCLPVRGGTSQNTYTP